VYRKLGCLDEGINGEKMRDLKRVCGSLWVMWWL